MSSPNAVRWPLPGTWMMRTGMVPPPVRATSTGAVASSGPTQKATRYVLIGIVSLNRTACLCVPSCGERWISSPLDTASSSGSTIRVTSKTALKSGSSQHGKARRQSVACICEVAITRSSPASSR